MTYSTKSCKLSEIKKWSSLRCLNGFFCLHVNRFSLGCLTLNMSQRSNCDIIVINLQIDFSFNWGEPPSASNLTSKKELKSPPHRMVVSSSKTKLLITSLISDKTVI